MKSKLPICLNLCLILFVLGSGAVFAETSSSPKPSSATSGSKATSSDAKDMKEITPPQVEKSSPLKFRIGIPAWASSVSGQAGVRGNVSDIGYISFTNIIEHLDYVVPGSLAVDYGKWGCLLEGQYVKLSENFSVPISGPLSGPLGAKINPVVGGTIEMEQAFADFNLSYKVVDTDKLTIAPFIGTRFEYVHISGSLQASGPLSKSLDEDGSREWADPILGIQAQYQIFKPTALVAKADVGGFGAASKLTYQFFAGTQTQLTRNMYVSAGYRYLSTDYNSDGFAYKVAYQGPQITFGVNFNRVAQIGYSKVNATYDSLFFLLIMLLKIRNLFVGMALFGMVFEQTPLLGSSPETSTSQAPAKTLSAEHLDQLLAPIALYPDPLLAQILPAATTPSDIVLAYRYVAAKKDVNKIDQQPWEESVKALARYPDVLKMMDEKLDWTTELGEAFIAQPKDVFDSVQRLRAKAQAVGSLKTSPQQVVVVEKEVIKIVPAQPDVIYVPVYQPSVVYVAQPVAVVAPVITFGAGLALGIWIHNELDWHNHHVYYHHSGWHGGYGGGNYHGGNNNINIDNSTNINVGNGSGNKVGNGGRNDATVWKPQSKPKPTPYGGGANNAFSQNRGPNSPNNNKKTSINGQKKPVSRPSQPTTRPASQSKPGFMSEGTKPRSSNLGGGSTSGNRQAPASRGGRDRN